MRYCPKTERLHRMDLHPYYPLLARTPLLRGMRPDELDTLLDRSEERR